MHFSLAELARLTGARLHGAGNCVIRGVAPIDRAGPGQISFVSGTRHRHALGTTKAAAVVLTAAHLDLAPCPALIAERPHVVFARICALLHPEPEHTPGVHPSAIVDPSATLHDSVGIAAGCIVGPGCVLDAGVSLGPGCVLGPEVHLGAHTRLLARVSVLHGCRIGAACLIHPGAVIGSDGFGLAEEADGSWVKVPQLGTVRIGDRVEIGANTTIDRGALDDTVIEEGVKIDNQVQVAHNVIIGAHTAIAGCVGIAGSARIGRCCRIGGGAVVLGHLDIADRVTVTALSLVTHSLREPGTYSSGTPIQNNAEWRLNAVRMKHLDDLARRLACLERRIESTSGGDDA